MKTLSFIIMTVALILSFQHLNGQCIEGNCINGKGTYYIHGEMMIVGYFKNGKPHGKAIVVLDNLIKIYGTYVNGMLDGNAIYVLPNQTKWYISFHNGVLHGESFILDWSDYRVATITYHYGEVEEEIIEDEDYFWYEVLPYFL